MALTDDELAALVQGLGSAFASDCAAQRFDIPGLEGQYFEVGVMDSGQDERVKSAAFRLNQAGSSGAASIDLTSEKVYELACRYTIKGYRLTLKGKSFLLEEGQLFGDDSLKLCKGLHPSIKDWLKEKMGRMNPNLQWAEGVFEKKGDSSSISQN